VRGEDAQTELEWILPRRIHRIMAVRANVRADSKLLCGAGPYDLVMFVRETEETGEFELTGRITKSGPGTGPVPGLPVRLVGAAGKAASEVKTTDERGEFRLTAGPGSRYGLRVGGEDDAPCVLVWDERNW
jgi:hypothetical protein